jgi:hypothetical protein
MAENHTYSDMLMSRCSRNRRQSRFRLRSFFRVMARMMNRRITYEQLTGKGKGTDTVHQA